MEAPLSMRESLLDLLKSVVVSPFSHFGISPSLSRRQYWSPSPAWAPSSRSPAREGRRPCSYLGTSTSPARSPCTPDTFWQKTRALKHFFLHGKLTWIHCVLTLGRFATPIAVKLCIMLEDSREHLNYQGKLQTPMVAFQIALSCLLEYGQIQDPG